MKRSGKSYEEALREAQRLGYAEANPKSDTSGSDAEAKLILLAAVTFRLRVKPGAILGKGIEEIHAIDFLYADREGAGHNKPVAGAGKYGNSIQAFRSALPVASGHVLPGI